MGLKNQPVKTYSSGMFARLAFAVAINVEPEILIVDEALSVGDVFFQNKCFKKFEELRSKDTTILFVSHYIHTVKQMCSRVLWIESGKLQLCGDSVEVCNAYTNSLLTKRGESFSDSEFDKDNYIINRFKVDDYPAISYTNESIINEDVKIISCFIKKRRGQITNKCDIKEDYVLSVLVESEINIENGIVGFVLESTKGQWIINCNSTICGDEKRITLVKDSITRVDFKFQMPSLMKGEYVIGAAVSMGKAEDYKVITWLYNVLAIIIVNEGNHSGVIDIDPDISVYNNLT